METVFGALRHLIGCGNKEQMLWGAAMLLLLLLLAVLHHRWKDGRGKLRLWRLLALTPLLMCIAHFVLYALPVTEPQVVLSYASLYAAGVLSLLPLLLAGRRIGYRIAAVVCGLLTVLLCTDYILTSPHLYNYGRESYTASFRSLVKDLDRTYVLKEWKEADFSALEQKYLPAVQEAEQEQNPAEFADAVMMFCNELHDGHVSVSRNYDRDTYKSEYQQHEYGLSMVQLDNGDVIAVCTTEKVNTLGIKDGTVITKWNGKPVLQAAAENVMDQGIPVRSNADRLAVFNLSGIGADSVMVSFLDESGSEKDVILFDLGEMHTLREAFNTFSGVPEIKSMEEYETYLSRNFSTEMLDDKCGLLTVLEEETGNSAHDLLGYLTGDHKWAREMFREKLRGLKAQGMEQLVIDLRNNMGGNDEIGFALVDLLTKDGMYGLGIGSRKNGQYVCNADHPVHGDGEFADLQVVALTNYDCASAGDSLAEALGKLPNVTLAGITDPCGCNQEVGGQCILSGGLVSVFYPTGLVLGEDGKPNIDTAADCISRNPVEVRIPLDYDAAMRLFRDKEDYELSWAQDYLAQQAK